MCARVYGGHVGRARWGERENPEGEEAAVVRMGNVGQHRWLWTTVWSRLVARVRAWTGVAGGDV